MPSEITSREKPRRHWTTTLGQAAAHPAAFAVVLLYALAWLAFDRRTFDFNAVATHDRLDHDAVHSTSSHRDPLAIHAKLDELIRAPTKTRARN
jgi:low affinity Fe/Cu permease